MLNGSDDSRGLFHKYSICAFNIARYLVIATFKTLDFSLSESYIATVIGNLQP